MIPTLPPVRICTLPGKWYTPCPFNAYVLYGCCRLTLLFKMDMDTTTNHSIEIISEILLYGLCVEISLVHHFRWGEASLFFIEIKP